MLEPCEVKMIARHKPKVLALLRKAAAHIAPDGMWWQGEYFKHSPLHPEDLSAVPCCPVGALGWAAGHYPTTFHPESYLNAAVVALRMALPDGHIYITVYNDDSDRTHDDIRELFHRAIASVEAMV